MKKMSFISIPIAIALISAIMIYLISGFKHDRYIEIETHSGKGLNYRIIHNTRCPLRQGKSSVFKKKHSKYDILIKNDAFFCSECFTQDEVEKLIIIHKINIKDLVQRYSAIYPKEEIKEFIMEYNLNPVIEDIY